MKILILSQYFSPEIGAPQVRLAALTRELVAAGHRVEVVTAVPNHPEGRVHDDYQGVRVRTSIEGAVPVHRVWMFAASGSGVARMASYLSFALSCSMGLRRVDPPDVLFVESPPPFVMVPAVFFARQWNARIVLNVADLWPDSATKLGLLDERSLVNRVLLRFERWAYRRSWRINSVTDGVRSVLEREKGIEPSKILDLPNGVDVELFQPRSTADRSVLDRYGVDRNATVLLYAGTVGFAHGLETAIRAMADVAATHPEAHLLVVGAGSTWDDAVSEVERLRLNNVTMYGPVAVEQVAELLNCTTAAVSTLRDSPLFEGTRPSKVFPAFASGVPVLYSGSGEGARLVEEAGAGLVTPAEDAASLAAAMRTVLDNPAEAQRMGQQGRRLAEDRFSWKSIAETWASSLTHDLTS